MTDRDVTAAFDLAAKTGVAWGVPFQPPETAIWEIGDPEVGQRGLNLLRRATRFMREVQPCRVYIEKPLEAHVASTIGTDPMTSLCLNGYVFVLIMVCQNEGIPWNLYERQFVLRHFTGQGRYKLKNDAKKACVLRCKQLRWGDLSFDEADACALKDKGDASQNPTGWALAGVNQAVKLSRKRL